MLIAGWFSPSGYLWSKDCFPWISSTCSLDPAAPHKSGLLVYPYRITLSPCSILCNKPSYFWVLRVLQQRVQYTHTQFFSMCQVCVFPSFPHQPSKVHPWSHARKTWRFVYLSLKSRIFQYSLHFYQNRYQIHIFISHNRYQIYIAIIT